MPGRWRWPSARWSRCVGGFGGAAGDAGGDVQDPVAEGADLTSGQIGVLGEAEQFGPRHQICCSQEDFQSCGVRVGPVTR